MEDQTLLGKAGVAQRPERCAMPAVLEELIKRGWEIGPGDLALRDGAYQVRATKRDSAGEKREVIGSGATSDDAFADVLTAAQRDDDAHGA